MTEIVEVTFKDGTKATLPRWAINKRNVVDASFTLDTLGDYSPVPKFKTSFSVSGIRYPSTPWGYVNGSAFGVFRTKRSVIIVGLSGQHRVDLLMRCVDEGDYTLGDMAELMHGGRVAGECLWRYAKYHDFADVRKNNVSFLRGYYIDGMKGGLLSTLNGRKTNDLKFPDIEGEV